jgi:diguanylate cyclase (GGDEF)-like protein
MPLDAADDWDARMRAVHAAERAGRWPEARTLAEAMWADGRQAGPMEIVLDAAVVAARVRANGDDLAGASAWLDEVLAEPRTAEAAAARADAWVVLAGVRASLGDGAGAAQAIQRAVELLANSSLDVEHRQRAYNGLSVAYYQLGLCLHAARMAQESVRILPPEPGDGAGMLRRLNLAMVLTVMHDQSSSLPDGLGGEDWLGLALDQIEVVEGQLAAMAPWLRLFHRVLQAGVWRRQGRVDEAVACLRDVQGADVAAPNTLLRYARQELAQSLALQGATRDEARALAEALLREAREAPDAATSMWQLENIAQLAEVAGRMDEAYQALSRSMALLRRNVVALLDTPAEGLSGIVDAQALRLFNVDLEERNRVLSRTVKDISRAAQFDALTGVLNRRGLEIEFGRVQGRGAFALAMLDVDHFKAINDQHSHLVGDAVLRRLGAVLQEHLRGPDVVGRWGGEEFMLLLDGAGSQRAMSIAERLRQHIESADWAELAPGLAVTVSIGVAVGGTDDSFTQVVKRADQELYAAKRAGRNRVCPA